MPCENKANDEKDLKDASDLKLRHPRLLLRAVPFRSFRSLWSLRSFFEEASIADGFIPPHGGYANLLSYRKAEIIYDATDYFCDRFFEKRDRTRDQMVQAARSGKQNIAEGSQASGTSKETELRLANVAHSSLEELPGDCLTFLLPGRRQYCRLSGVVYNFVDGNMQKGTA